MTASKNSSRATDRRKAAEPHPPAVEPGIPAHPRTGKDFGKEGTNKTQAVPKPDNAAPEDLGIALHIEKSPYTRG